MKIITQEWIYTESPGFKGWVYLRRIELESGVVLPIGLCGFRFKEKGPPHEPYPYRRMINPWEGYEPSKEEYYFYKGNIYKKIDEITTKHPATREWVPFVLYKNAQGQLFSREINEFYERFTLIKDTPTALSIFHKETLRASLNNL